MGSALVPAVPDQLPRPRADAPDRGVSVDHTTLFRWIQAYAPELDQRLRPHLRLTTGSWRVDENAAYPRAVTDMKRDKQLWRFSKLRQVNYLNNMVPSGLAPAPEGRRGSSLVSEFSGQATASMSRRAASLEDGSPVYGLRAQAPCAWWPGKGSRAPCHGPWQERAALVWVWNPRIGRRRPFTGR